MFIGNYLNIFFIIYKYFFVQKIINMGVLEVKYEGIKKNLGILKQG